MTRSIVWSPACNARLKKLSQSSDLTVSSVADISKLAFQPQFGAMVSGDPTADLDSLYKPLDHEANRCDDVFFCN